MIVKQFEESGTAQAFFTDKHIASNEQANETAQQLAIASDAALAVSFAMYSDSVFFVANSVSSSSSSRRKRSLAKKRRRRAKVDDANDRT